MSYKVRYEYDVLAGGAGIKGLSSREDARVEKRALEAIDGYLWWTWRCCRGRGSGRNCRYFCWEEAYETLKNS